MLLNRLSTQLLTLFPLLLALLFSPLVQAEAREQKVRLEVISPGDGGQCQVKAVFKGDTDNCKNKKALIWESKKGDVEEYTFSDLSRLSNKFANVLIDQLGVQNSDRFDGTPSPEAKGRDNCHKDEGCVCTRQEKHITWEMKNKEPFSIKFDQGSSNPFVQKGDSECNFKSNKKGKLRCRVKGKDVPRAFYRYSVHVENCASTVAQIKIY